MSWFCWTQLIWIQRKTFLSVFTDVYRRFFCFRKSLICIFTVRSGSSRCAVELIFHVFFFPLLLKAFHNNSFKHGQNHSANKKTFRDPAFVGRKTWSELQKGLLGNDHGVCLTSSSLSQRLMSSVDWFNFSSSPCLQKTQDGDRQGGRGLYWHRSDAAFCLMTLWTSWVLLWQTPTVDVFLLSISQRSAQCFILTVYRFYSLSYFTGLYKCMNKLSEIMFYSNFTVYLVPPGF